MLPLAVFRSGEKTMFNRLSSPHLRALPVIGAVMGLLLFGGCAFNVVTLHANPTTLTPSAEVEPRYILQSPIRTELVSGWATPLRAATRWQKIGQITEGEVFRTKDQVLTVEASNLYQADIVVKDGNIVGYYIPTSKSFTPCQDAKKINLIIPS